MEVLGTRQPGGDRLRIVLKQLHIMVQGSLSSDPIVRHDAMIADPTTAVTRPFGFAPDAGVHPTPLDRGMGSVRRP